MKTVRVLATLVVCAPLAGMAQAIAKSASPAFAVELSRAHLGDQLEQNLAAGKRALEAAQAQAKRLSGEARARFETAARDVHVAAQHLRESLAAAQNATPSEWEPARAALAADYEIFTRALVEAQRIAHSASAEIGSRSRAGNERRQR